MLSAWFRGRRARVETPAPRPSAPAEAAWSAAVEAIQARVVRWFAQEPPALVALAQASVPPLVAARPRLVDPAIPNPTPLAWLAAALDVLESWPEPLPVPRRAPALAWRYLLFLRVACDALEAAYDQVWRQGWATVCPLTDLPDPHSAPRPLRPARDRLPPSSAGLGALLIGLRLPEAGQQCIYEALAAGVDWVHPAAFWREFGIVPASQQVAASPPGHATPSESVKPATRPEPVRPPTHVPARKPAANPGTTPSVAMPAPELPTRVAAPVPETADPLAAIVRATLASWVAHPSFNRQSGDGWRVDDLYVAAKPFAEALQAHAWVAAQPELGNRKQLYRQLAERGLILPHGGQRVWNLFVTEHGRPESRYVSALKLAPSLYAGLEVGPFFNGALRLARARADGANTTLTG